MVGFVAAILAVITDPEARERYRRIRRDPMMIACILLVVSALPAAFMSENRPRAFRELRAYWELLIYFLVAYNLVSAKLRRLVFWTLFTSMSISALVALIQYSGGLELLFVSIDAKTYRPGSTLYNMTFAGILYQLISLNSAVWFQFRRAGAVGVAAGVAAQIAALVVTLTRGAWLALIGGLFAIPLVLRRRVLFVVMAGAIVVAGALALQNDAIRERARSIGSSLRSPSDSNVSTRLVLWDISWQVFKENPVFGVGIGDYSIEAERHLAGRQVVTTVDSHNVYLQLLATRGLVGFLPFVWFWLALFRSLVDSKRYAEQHDAKFARHFAAGAIAATVAVLIGALSENNIDDSEVFMCFMFITGMARSFRISPDAGSARDDGPKG
jgi:O-antigen ligase